MKHQGHIYLEVDRAIALSDSAADPEWRRQFMIAVYATARTELAFTVDTVWQTFRALGFRGQTANRMAAGGAMRQGARAGWMRRSDVREHVPNRSNHNYDGIAIWNSLVYDPSLSLRDFETGGQKELELGT